MKQINQLENTKTKLRQRITNDEEKNNNKNHQNIKNFK